MRIADGKVCDVDFTDRISIFYTQFQQNSFTLGLYDTIPKNIKMYPYILHFQKKSKHLEKRDLINQFVFF